MPVTSGLEILAVGKLRSRDHQRYTITKWYDNIHIVLLVCRCLVKGAEDLVKKGKSAFRVDNKAAKVTTRSQLKKVQPSDVDQFDTWQVTESLDDAVVLIVYDERTTTLAVPTIAQFTLASTESARVGDLDDICIGLEGLEECDGFLCLLEGFDIRSDHKGNLFDFLDTVTAGKNERGEGRSSEGGYGGEATLVLVDFDVPFTPGLGGSKHTTTTTHVTESTLYDAMVQLMRKSRK